MWTAPDPRVTHHANLSHMVGYAWSNALRSISAVATLTHPTIRPAYPAAAASLLHIRCFDDRSPTRDLAFDQRSKPRLSPLCLVGNIAGKVEQALAYGLVVECSIERVGELVEDRLRCGFGRKQTVPRRHLKLRQPRFDRGRYVGQNGTARRRRNGIDLDRPAMNLLHDIGGRIAGIVDLAGDQRVDRRR